MMVGMVQVTPQNNYWFRVAIPGSEIPVWFSNQSVGDSVTEKFPLDASNSKLIGFAACALIVPQENPSAHRGVDPNAKKNCEIVWRFESNCESWGFSVDLNQIASDHLLLVVASPIRRLEDTCHLTSKSMEETTDA